MQEQVDTARQKILAQVDRYITLTTAEQEYFLSCLQVKKLRRRQYLLQAREICRYESFVVEGCLRSFYVDDNGDEHTLHFAIEDWWISDLGSYLRQQPAAVHIEALSPVTVWQLDLPALEQLYREVPAFEKYFRILHQNAYIAQNERILHNISMTGAQRYEAFLKKYPALPQRIPQKYLASYLGITPVFLSQIRSKNTGKEE
ncbi:Crp/Fnr family transcriptional regulator [Chitinophaga pendula]|uniref:Crp/Fnr family transcriptional regulator n=1 Tax=Chitinophaga TaxID=79328 RepID=UPI000BAF034C|nr:MULTISPECIES: Crp/Fnr family transcriptional regulator [Chitinophaga]ASZ12762.1 hypothetical protein CK934_18270 [Chitinophaga sp. MD30]UCJ09618.1 Crp/Fnr family transcriptional regulator [Chitinophaga pendula]